MGESVEPVRRFPRLGLLNGLALGLAAAAGAWLPEAIRLSRTPVSLQLPSLLLAALLLAGLFALTGWLTGRRPQAVPVFLLWLAAAAAGAISIGYQPYAGRTLTVWLLDPRFWGRPIYPAPPGLTPGLTLVTGLLLILLLALLALLQNFRLEAIAREMTPSGRLPAAAWLILLLPAPLVFGAAYATQAINGDPAAVSLQIVDRAIRRVQTAEGDLFALGLAEGINYSALRGVRDRIDGDYTLAIGGVDAAASLTTVTAVFENGSWIGCQVISEQLTFCQDASPPYTSGLAALITGAEPPADCFNCVPQAAPDTRTWLASRRGRFGPDPRVTRLAQRGAFVLMRVTAAAGDFAAECWFSGVRPVTVDVCREIDPLNS